MRIGALAVIFMACIGMLAAGFDDTNPSAGGIGTPGSSTDDAIVRWDGTGGDTLQDSASGPTVSDSGVMTMQGNIDLDGNRLTFDNDVDTFLQGLGDDDVVFFIGGSQKMEFTFTEITIQERIGMRGLVADQFISSNSILRLGTSVASSHGFGNGAVIAGDELEVDGILAIDDPILYDLSTIAVDDTAPPVSAGTIFFTSANTVATAITDLDNNVGAGQVVTLCGGSDTNSSTIADAGNFNLSAAMTLSLDDCITLLVQADNDYIELSRVDN